MKVVKRAMGNGYSVVPSCTGLEIVARGGAKSSYEPLPACHVPTGFGRTDEEAWELANEIAALMNANLSGKSGCDVAAEARLQELRSK